MTKLPTARTRDEALLWLERTPCPRCAASCFTWAHGLDQDDNGELVIVYDADCPSCGTAREHFFALPAQETSAVFGGPEPSELLDAGQWLGLADEIGSRVPRDDPPARAEALAVAAAAVEEVLKFIPPNGDQVPAEAFWTDEGRRVRDELPGRFRRDRLQVVLDTYRAMA